MSHFLNLSEVKLQRNFRKQSDRHSDAKNFILTSTHLCRMVSDGTLHTSMRSPLTLKYLFHCGTKACKLAQKKISVKCLQPVGDIDTCHKTFASHASLRGSEWLNPWILSLARRFQSTFSNPTPLRSSVSSPWLLSLPSAVLLSSLRLTSDLQFLCVLLNPTTSFSVI